MYSIPNVYCRFDWKRGTCSTSDAIFPRTFGVVLADQLVVMFRKKLRTNVGRVKICGKRFAVDEKSAKLPRIRRQTDGWM